MNIIQNNKMCKESFVKLTKYLALLQINVFINIFNADIRF